jgi:hypothetical protein
MIVTIPIDQAQADAHLPEAKSDGSGVGINYADQILKNFKVTLSDGRKMLAKRRGLKITLTIGDKSGEAILRRIENGPDVKNIFYKALAEASQNAGANVSFAPDQITLEVA